ncbi:hypothetical protein HOY80DRAFT_1028085 [Tuber brumale]|nr:hypothetical protein HOY80DRAFT_1028085 [Tuber brumale]
MAEDEKMFLSARIPLTPSTMIRSTFEKGRAHPHATIIHPVDTLAVGDMFHINHEILNIIKTSAGYHWRAGIHLDEASGLSVQISTPDANLTALVDMWNLAKGKWAVIMWKYQWRRRRAPEWWEIEDQQCADSNEEWEGEDSGGDSDHEEELVEEEHEEELDEKDLGENTWEEEHCEKGDREWEGQEKEVVVASPVYTVGQDGKIERRLVFFQTCQPLLAAPTIKNDAEARDPQELSKLEYHDNNLVESFSSLEKLFHQLTAIGEVQDEKDKKYLLLSQLPLPYHLFQSSVWNNSDYDSTSFDEV